MKPLVFAVFTLVLGLCDVAGAQQHGYLIREQRTVNMDDIQETWQLVWDGTPRESSCGPHQVYMAITCSCFGFAYAQEGKLLLVRKHGGREMERLSLSGLFGLEGADNPVWQQHGTLAALQRWGEPLSEDADRELNDDPSLATEIMRRPKPATMKLADYDRDSRATEFLLHVANLPCGKEYDVAVGISKTSPQLHALSSVANPDEPLLLPRHAWEALLTGPGEHTVIQWECGDHGSNVHEELVVSADNGRIRARHLEYSCPFDPASPNLTSEMEF